MCGRSRTGEPDPAGEDVDGTPAAAQRTKAELYERAKALDVSGRSTMTKDELADAIRRHNA